jgi:hypothetical protein
MFIFLTRLGRLFVGAVAVIAVTSLFGFSTLTSVPVASHHKADPSCSVSPNPSAVNATYVVSATGLPVLSAINLIVKYGNGTVTASPLGSTPDGTFNMNESSPVAGTTTYEFTGLIRNNTQIYATCSVTIS